MESTNRPEMCIIKNMKNERFPYFIQVANGDFFPMENPLMAYRLPNEEEAKKFAEDMGVTDYEIEFVK